MSSAAKDPYITPEEYLERERLAEFKSEYLEGRIYAMSGARRPHNLIAANLSRVIGNQIEDRPCELYIADMRVRVGPTGLHTYPDLSIVCGEPRFQDGEFDTLLDPNVIIEILSKSTEHWDRGGKSGHYRRLASLNSYILISQNRIFVEHFTRQGENWLLAELESLDDTLFIASIQSNISLREIYNKVPLVGGQATPGT